uniref:Ricin B-type lectin domain-containing protein n=1 Tax=Mesocestoides corti TaxID=53468 RepID=A0A5K3EL30_MESCO
RGWEPIALTDCEGRRASGFQLNDPQSRDFSWFARSSVALTCMNKGESGTQLTRLKSDCANFLGSYEPLSFKLLPIQCAGSMELSGTSMVCLQAPQQRQREKRLTSI